MQVTSVKRIHQKDWTDEGIRFLRARDIVAAAKKEKINNYLYISVEKYNEFTKISGKVSQGDLLVTGVGTIGVPMLVTDDKPLYFKDGNIIWFKNDRIIQGLFFYYSFINRKIQNYIRDVAGTGTVGTYTIDSGKKTPILLTSSEEQKKIGSFFNQLDTAITLHQRKLDKLKQLKQGYLREIFDQKLRFLDFTNEWIQNKLSDLMIFSNGINAPKENYGKGRKMISVMDILAKEPFIYEKIMNSVEVEDKIEQKSKVENGDLVFVRSSEIAEEVGWAKAYLQDEYALYSGFSIRGKKKNNYDAYFIELSLNSVNRKQIESKAGGSTRFNVSQEILNKIVVTMPILDEQIKISNFFKQLSKSIFLQQEKIEQLSKLKKAYLQKMFV